MRNRAIILFVFAMSILIGCLGTGGGSSSSPSVSGTLSSTAAISGNVYLQSTSLYGGIAIQAKDINGVVVGNAVTDGYGNFYFNELVSGVYSLYATTGESEVNFISGIQVIPGVPKQVPQTALIELSSVNLDQITSTSVRIKFNSTVECISQIQFSAAGGNSNLQTVSTLHVKDHQTTITGLTPTTRYSFIVKLQSQNGQSFTYSSLSATTLSAIGPSRLALNIENGLISTKFTSVQLNFDADDAAQMRIGETENLDDKPWVAYTPTTNYNLTPGDGTKRIYAQFRDSFGNQTSVINDSILLQSSISGHIGVWINNGEAITNDVNVLLSFLYPGATEIMYSDSPDFINTFWEKFTNVKKFKFDSGDGPKTIYAKFRGGNADEYKVFTGVIQLDTTGPEVLMAINDGDLKTNSINVKIAFTPIQMPARMKVSMDETFADQTQWLPFQSEYNFLLSKEDGDKTVYAKFEDELSNPFGPISSQIELDTTAPDATSFDINDGAEETDSLNVTLKISADDATYIMISNDENFTDIKPERYKTIKTWVLGGYDVQSVYMSFIDDASNSSPILTKSIIVNGTAPSSSSVAINEDDPTTESATNSITIFSDDAKTIRISTNQNFGTQPDITFTPNLANGAMRIENFTFSREAGEKFAYVRFVNASGTYSISSDSITLIGPASYSLSTFEEQPLSTYTVNLRPFALNATEMLITEDYGQLANSALWQPFSFSHDFLLTKTNGKHTIYFKYRNIGHIETTPLSIDLIVSEVAPATPSILINDGDSSTTNSNVTIKTLADAKYQNIRLSNTNAFATEDNKSPGYIPWELNRTAGEKIVYARFQHSDTGLFEFANDTINAIGPASPTISTNETSPLDKNWLILNLYAGEAREMIVTEDPGIANITTGWETYKTQLSFQLASSTGAHTIYAKFRSTATNYIETIPVKLVVTVDSEAPSGNTASFRATADSASDELFEITPASLPIFLHFDVADSNTATITWQIIPAGSVPTNTYTQSTAPLAPELLDSSDFTGNGTFNLYYKFSDGAGNETPLGIKSITLAGAPASDNTVTINEGDPTAENATVTLIIYSETAKKVKITTDQNFGVATNEDFLENYMTDTMQLTYNLSQQAGEKIIYVRFEDASGTYSISSDTITLVGPTDQALTTTEDQPLTTYTVNLRPFAINASEMLITEDYAELSNSTLWQPFSYSHNFQLSIENGVHTVYAKYRNIGKVETTPLSIDLSVSEIPLATPAIMINDGDALTYSSNVNIKVITTSEYPIVRLSNDGIFTTVADTAAVDQPWFIDNVAGVKTIYSRFQHSSTGEFIFSEDTITAIGPASPSISTNDSLPLNTNLLTLQLYAGQATDMIVTEDSGIADLTVGWVPYQTSLVFPLSSTIGDHIVYVKYRNAATNYIETAPIPLTVSVNSVSPSGNTATFRETADPVSTEITEIAIASLPVFLYFNIADVNTATVSWQLAAAGAALPTVFNESSVPLAPILLNTGDFPGNGTFNMYYKFADGVGNETALAVKSIKINGPSLNISPATLGPLSSGQTQQFSATLENAVGTIQWSITPQIPASTYGSIDSNGLYTAPNPVTVSDATVVTASLFGSPSVNDQVTVSLQTQVEVDVAQLNHQVSLNLSKEIPVIFRNSTMGGAVTVTVSGGGTAMISAPDVGDPNTDRIATITFIAPATLPSTNPVSVTVSSSEDITKQKVLYFTINTGPWVSLTPTDGISRIGTGQINFAATTSSPAAVLTWQLPKGGFFDAAKTLTTKTTTAPHNVTFYAPDSFGAFNPLQVIASFSETSLDYYATASISLSSPVSLALNPNNETIDLGNTAGILMQANVENATTTQVIWQYKNASSATWLPIDGPTDLSGSLQTSGNDALYLPPATFPAGLSNLINIKATSSDDSLASGVATITLIAPIEIVIHEGYNSSSPIATETTVTLEIGNRQFFAEIRNATAGTNLTVEWYVEDISGGNSTYGTVDTTGKYTSPDTAAQSQVTLKAVSNANTSIATECTILLENFWIPKSQNLNDVTLATDSIYCLLIDPTTAAGTPRILYCGTNGQGMYRTTIAVSGSDYNWSNINWTGVTGLSTDLVGQPAQNTVNDITISMQNNDRLVAATNGGLYLITAGTASKIVVPGTTRPDANNASNYSSDFTEVFSGAIIDPTNDDYMYAIGKDQGVLRFIWNSGSSDYDYNGTLYDDNQTYSGIEYESLDWTKLAGTASETTGTALIPKEVVLSSGTMEFNCIAMNKQDPNTLFIGYSKFLSSRNPDVFKNGYLKLTDIRTNHYLYVSPKAFSINGDQVPTPAADITPPAAATYAGAYEETIPQYKSLHPSGIISHDSDTSIILDFAIDPNTPTTLWSAKNSGIFRSTDDGSNWSSTGAYTNVRTIFIDPINTINVYIGTENGLYRTKDAGTSWKQIKTGLEGHTTINGLGLSPGGVGARRIFSGSTGGVFMGRTSLDLE